MAIIYVKEQGSCIRKRDRHVFVEKNGKELAEIPLHNITGISIIGNVQVTTQVLHMFMQEGIDVSFFSYSGNYLGHVAAESSKNIFLRFAQYERYQDINARMEMSRRIVRNKVQNQIAVIRNFRWADIEYDYNQAIRQMLKLTDTLDEKKTSNEIMGVEGACSAIYFSAYGKMFRCKLEFHGRNRRPPKDPINVILSLAYTLLTKEIAAALEAESFETYLGFLHGIRYGRKSLALDLVEEFRQPAVDRLVLRLFNKQMLSEIDFEIEDGKVTLREDGFKKFCTEYEKWMKKPVGVHEKQSFRSMIRQQVSCLKKAIREQQEYAPYEWREKDVSD